MNKPEEFGKAAGAVYIEAIKTAKVANLVNYDKLHAVGLLAVEAWLRDYAGPKQP